jgi:hypothetical protein
MSYLKEIDPDIYNAIYGETERQDQKLELIASENSVSTAVMEAAWCPTACCGNVIGIGNYNVTESILSGTSLTPSYQL